MKQAGGVDLLHVPYKASPIVDVIGGRVTMFFAPASAAPAIADGRLRALAVTGARRSPAVAELPTMMEAGVAGYESATWYGIVAPAGTPADIVNRLSSEVVAILKGPEMNDRLSKEGADPVGNTPAEFARHIQTEIEKWRKVIRAAGIQPS